MKSYRKALGVFVAGIGLALSPSANADPILQYTTGPVLQFDAVGKLTGALNVDVAGSNYNVRFDQGRCADFFGSCSTSSFTFHSMGDANTAAQILLDQVLLDTRYGNYDTTPNRVAGCPFATASNPCIISTPYESSATDVNSGSAFNFGIVPPQPNTAPVVDFVTATGFSKTAVQSFAIWEQAAPVKILTGALNVNVGGTLYDVQFQPGTCTAVFGTCATPSFAFNSISGANAASQALLDQVLLDGASGNFDTDQYLTFGCNNALYLGLNPCFIYTPYAFDGLAETILVQNVGNNAVPGSGYLPNVDFLSNGPSDPNHFQTYAVWTQSQSDGTETPILPVSTGDGGAFEFHFDVLPEETYFIDPSIAIGYDYQIGAGDPNFQSVLLPTGIGDGRYDIFGFDSLNSPFLLAGDWLGGTAFDFAPGGVDHFRVLGIEASAGLDPSNSTAFVTGLTFTGNGQFTGTQMPLVAAAANDIPEPPALLLFGFGLTALVSAGRAVRVASAEDAAQRYGASP